MKRTVTQGVMGLLIILMIAACSPAVATEEAATEVVAAVDSGISTPEISVEALPTPIPTLAPIVVPTALPTREPDPVLDAGMADAAALLEAGNTAGAAASYNTLVLQFPDRADPLVGLAAVAHANGDEEARIQQLRNAVSLDPTYFDAWVELASAYNTNRDHFYDGLLNVYTQMINIRPNDPQNYISLAGYYSHYRMVGYAVKNLELAYAVADGEDLSSSWAEVATISNSIRRYNNAATIAQYGLIHYPDSVDLLFVQAFASISQTEQVRKNDWAQSQVDQSGGISVAPTASPTAEDESSSSGISLGVPEDKQTVIDTLRIRHEADLVLLEQILALDPDHAHAQYLKGYILREMDKIDESLVELKKAADLALAQENYTLAFEAMADIVMILSETQTTADAEAYVEPYRETYGERAEMAMIDAIITWKKGEPMQALDTIEPLAVTDYPAAVYYKGMIMSGLPDLKKVSAQVLNRYAKVLTSGPRAEEADQLSSRLALE